MGTAALTQAFLVGRDQYLIATVGYQALLDLTTDTLRFQYAPLNDFTWHDWLTVDATGVVTIPGLAGQPLTRVDDANVTLVLTGTPLTALLRPVTLTVGWTGILPVARGGIGVGTLATNGVLFGTGTAAINALAVNATATKMFLSQSNSNPPAWSQVAGTDLTGTTLATGITISSITNSTVSRSSGVNATAMTWADTVTGAQTVGFGLQLRWTSNAGGSVAAIGLEVGGTGTNNESQIAFYTQNSAGALTRRGTWKSDGGLKIESATSGSSTDTLENRSSALFFNGTAMVGGSGSSPSLPKWTAASTLGDSILSQPATTTIRLDNPVATIDAVFELVKNGSPARTWSIGTSSGVSVSFAIKNVTAGTTPFVITNSGTTQVDELQTTTGGVTSGAFVLSATTMHSGGDFDVNGFFTVAGASGNLAINTNKFTVAGASGNTLVAGTLDVTSDFKVATTKFTVTASSGNTVIGGTLALTGKVTTYNNIATEGWGVPAIAKVGRSTGQTTAVASVAAYTLPVTADASFLIYVNVNVTTSTTHSFSVQVDYTDETVTARTLTITVSQLAGTFITAITNVTGAGPYEGVPVQIRCRLNTAITVKTTGTFTSVTYNVEAAIVRIA